MTSRKRTLWPWTVATLLVPVLYVLSFGPACWWLTHTSKWGQEKVSSVYAPIGYVARKCYQASRMDGGPIYRTIAWYATLKHQTVLVPANCFDGNGAFGQLDRPIELPPGAGMGGSPDEAP